MLAVWAIKGCMAYAKTDDPAVALIYVNAFMEELRNGDGDAPFQGLRERDEARSES
jgi:hypothetical protein